jgi:O-antigen/teichoic acid export membrane protein
MPYNEEKMSNAFAIDLFINYIAYAITAIGGLTYLYVCAYYLGIDGLGVISQIMAIYVIVAQIAVGGVQFSALKSASESESGLGIRAERIWSALIVTLGWGAVIAIIAFAISPLIGQIVKSPKVGEGFSYASLALVFFALNKSMASALNGLNQMRRFAIQAIMRSVTLVLFTWLLSLSINDPAKVSISIILSEIVLFLYLILQMFAVIGKPTYKAFNVKNFADHLWFGMRGMWSGVAYEINVRIDVLIVGVFLQDNEVGMYSVAAQLAEGFYNILIVLRNQLAPVVSGMIESGDIFGIRSLCSRMIRVVLPIIMTIALIGYYGYAPVVAYVLPGRGYEMAGDVLGILLSGIVLTAWVSPFEIIYVLAGRPGQYSLMMMFVMLMNLVSNLIMIPIYGIVGAAVATSMVTVLSGIYLVMSIRRIFGFWLFPDFRLINM